MDIQQIHQDVYEELQAQVTRNPELRIRPRKTNRGGKLEERGWWFLGNDGYLSIGFWKGMNWKTRIPNISFMILKDGSSYLEISVTDSHLKKKFVDQQIIPDLGLISPNSYTKKYKPDSYILSLRHFLSVDWPVINEAIKSLNKPSEDRLPFGLISEEESRHDLANLVLFQSRYLKLLQKKKLTLPLRLQSLSVQHYGPIQDISIENISRNTQWIFLTGENGSGKSSLLRALTIGLCRNNDNGIIDDTPEFNIQLTLAGAKTREYKINSKGFKKGSKIIPEGLAVYGPNRLLTDTDPLDKQFISIEYEAIKKKKTFGLFYPFDVLMGLSSTYDLGEKPRYTKIALGALIDNLNEILKVLGTAVDHNKTLELIFWDDLQQDLDLKHSKPFEKLSSGTKSFCALIIDLLLRLKKQQPDVDDPSEYAGIVIIDEIDLHLHPTMQKEIVKQLSETFPKLQFIVSTHSPIPLLGAPENSLFVRVIKDKELNVVAEKLDIDVTKLTPNLILTSPIFGFSGLFSDHLHESINLNTEDTWAEKQVRDSGLSALLKKYQERKARSDND